MTGRAKDPIEDFTTRAAWMRRLVLILMFAGGVWFVSLTSRMGAEARPLRQATVMSTNIVISQFRTNGSGGPTDEFVELFNPIGVDIEISGWNIRYSASNGTPITRCTIPSIPPTLLSPGQHYLIASNGFDDGYVVDLACDLAIADDGGIAITLEDNTVVDAVGMGTGTAFKEGTVLSPLISGDDSYIRRPYNNWHGCYDNGDNSIDFVVSSPPQPQNMSSLPFFACGSAPTETNTSTNTNTPTITETRTPTLSPTTVFLRSVVINEVAWAGTSASPYDEWIELYNTTANDIELTGWRLTATNNGPTILLEGIIPSNGYFLLEGGDDSTVSNIQADQIFPDDSFINLSNNGATLRLYAPTGIIDDTANINAGPWDAGTSYPTIRSMERRGRLADGLTSWTTFAGSVRNGLDARNSPINGTPRLDNWANSVTPTATFTPSTTRTRTLTRTPTRPPPPTITRTPTAIKDFVILNELLPHALTDLNGDGKADVGDEYIELINLTNLTVTLHGWVLADRDPTTASYAIPTTVISPGERLAFFASVTGQYLSDGGDTVVLVRPGGTPADILTYPVISQLGQTWCRFPDGSGGWYFGCVPSPNLSNVYQPNPLPTPTPLPQFGPVDSYFSACPLSNVDETIQLAECVRPGLDIWNPAHWDAPDFNTLPMYLENEQYPPVSLE
jgi:hypothetical protein